MKSFCLSIAMPMVLLTGVEASSIEQASQGDCSPTVADVKGNVTIVCSGVPGKTPGQPRVDVLEKYPQELYWHGTGYGGMAKGKNVCIRAADMYARAAIAHQLEGTIRDRLTITNGEVSSSTEEDTNRILRDVQIVDSSVDEVKGECVSNAILRRAMVDKLHIDHHGTDKNDK